MDSDFMQPDQVGSIPAHDSRGGTRWYLMSLLTQVVLQFHDSKTLLIP